MPRQARLDAPDTLPRVIVRGIDPRPLFWDGADRADFLACPLPSIEMLA